ncbi:2-C-methyl-D-erythritol 4-phosphate cytidylyltransferase [Acetohalobium arabaticum]|uniref:2-C-methyl-D-erythritol 4-phosphate cytidylyltransferase n=1 Tax=Acetohalobium arabaticum (strain ATCC 49924 / DSM 5501 / Z-7288) TaxID=574087 RepID=D9QSZ9_ACEAZ|nr:2-C-methyl-D-erythritol 4-phosphate cytidylyltransferase [Acetohalobium arabaticum]ADL11687.1 2-C-methyl-D-erythritol 4-phosphate cytidylyltransferase [Acetohalobium arabaticum DSM 5501]
MESITAIIPAAGQGKRMKSKLNKQYLSLLDKPVLAHTVEVFQNCDLITEIIVVVKEDEIDYCRRKVIEKYNYNKVKALIRGGQSRQKSVHNGLQSVDNADYVLIHDGARPLLTEDMLCRAVDQVKDYKAVGVAVPVKDTIKRIDNDGYVAETPVRDKLWAIQTPQAFEYSLVSEAYNKAMKEGISGTDTSILVERLGQKVKLIRGSYENLKITTPEDLINAEAIIKRRQQ